jgi:hypothetical protein
LKSSVFIFRVEEYNMQETSMRAGGKQSNQLADISDYMGNRREMEDSKSVPGLARRTE